MPMRYRTRRVIAIPPSTDRTIVFPYNWRTRKFSTTHYHPEMLNNAAPTEEVTQFLQEIERQLTGYHSAAGHTLTRVMSIGLLIVIIIVGITIPLVIKHMNQSTEPGDSLGFPTVIPIAFGILFGYMFLFIILQAVFRARGRSKLREVRENATTFISQRAADCTQRGFAWVLPFHFPFWIELVRIGSKYPQQPMQPFCNPVPMQQLGAYNNLTVPQYGEVLNTSSDALYTQNSSMMTIMQPMQIQMQPMQVQIQPPQGICVQNQYGYTYNQYSNLPQ